MGLMSDMNERGVMTVYMQVPYRKPGQSGSTWYKTVTLTRELHVTMQEAREILEKWKRENPDAFGEFRLGMH